MSDSLSKKTKYNNSDKPLFMAWVGRDKPEHESVCGRLGQRYRVFAVLTSLNFYV